MTTRITVPEPIREYLIGKYCDLDANQPVYFPDGDDLYHCLYDLIEKRPANAPMVDSGNIELHLPKRRVGKNPDVYNYISQRAQAILTKRIETKMWAECHDYLDEQKHLYGINYIDGVVTFMKRYQIYSLSEDAFLKNYYRWRTKVREKNKKREYRRKS